MKNNIFPLYLRLLKDRRISFLVYSLVSIGFSWMYVALFPGFAEQSEKLEQLLEVYPESMIKAFNIDIATFVKLEGFMAVEMFSIIWPIFLIIIVTAIAGATLAGEIEKGTLEIILAQPLSRTKIFFARYGAGFTIMAVFVLTTIYAVVPLAWAYDINCNVGHFSKLVLVGFLFGLAVFSMAMFFSSIFKSKGIVYFLNGGVIVVMYVLNIVAGLKENLSNLKYGSFFYYFDSTGVLVHGKIDNWAYLVFIGTAVIFTILGAFIFNKRDIAV